jgi:UDP-GlcNAc:undecaprenyl-phosphate GlcNAc-1-phosphate transferase
MISFYIYCVLYFIFIFLIYTKRNLLAKKLSLFDHPNDRKIHQFPTPSIGFLLFIPIILLSLINLYSESFISFKILLLVLFLTFFFSILGFIDDRNHISAKVKTFLIISCLLTVLPLEANFIINNLNFYSTNYVIVLNQGSLFFTIFCIFFLYNTLNFSDGLNGISLSLVIFWVIYILIFINQNYFFYHIILLALTITLIPNVFGKIFIGNTGVNFLSILFSYIFITEYNNNSIKFDEIIFLTLIPSIDIMRVVIERLINNKSPLQPDRNHLHHLLLKYFTKNIAFIPYISICILPIILFRFFNFSYLVLIFSFFLYFLILLSCKYK